MMAVCEISEENDIDERFKVQVCCKKCFFDYESCDEVQYLRNIFIMTSLSLWWSKVCFQLIIGFLSYRSWMKFMDSFKLQIYFWMQCKQFPEEMDDIKLEEWPTRSRDLLQFCRNRKRELKTIRDILDEIFQNHSIDTYQKLCIAL